MVATSSRASKRQGRLYVGTGVALLAVTAAVALARSETVAEAPRDGPPPRYFGVNLPSASFGGGKRSPPVHGKDYIYPTAETAASFREMGMNTVRLAFKWERLQPELMGRLDPEEVARLDKSVRDLSGFKTIVLDVHNYAKYRGARLDEPGRSGEMLADLWAKLAERYKSNPRVAFGIMNEPHGIDVQEWRRISDQTVSAIRRTGAKNLILIPGTRWTGGHSWFSGGSRSNATVMSDVIDPGRNFVYEIHQYLDSDSSGTKKDCVDATVGERRLTRVTQWLREQKASAILAEFGVPPTPTCLAALDNLLTFLRRNGDVWVGWTYWAGGDWWGDYPYSIQPKDGEVRPQAAILQQHIASYTAASRR